MCCDELTEIGRTTCSLLGWDINEFAGTQAVGEPNANCEAMVVDENTNEEITARGPDARGELWCRGPNIMRGYDLTTTIVLDSLLIGTDTGTTKRPRTRHSLPTVG